MLSTLIKDLIDFTRASVRKPVEPTGSCDADVVEQAEAEEQAYQEAKREHPGG